MSAGVESENSIASDQPGDVNLGAKAIRVLFVEDDALYRNTMALELEARGLIVRQFAEGRSLIAALDNLQGDDDADVIILDWHLPKLSGIDLFAAIRRRGVKMPVVFLTGRNVIAYENQALDLGAADFVTKSRGVDILVRRLKFAVDASTYNKAPSPARRIVYGDLTLQCSMSRASWKGEDLNLTLGEYSILEMLLLRVGDYVTYRALYDVLRGPGFVAGQGTEGYRTNVRSAIKRTRNKFRAIDAGFEAIESYVGFGYRWRP